MSVTHTPAGTVITCRCGDEQLAFMFDLLDQGLGQWDASQIAYGGPAAVADADLDVIGFSPGVRKAWCRAVVRRLFAPLRISIGLPVEGSAP